MPVYFLNADFDYRKMMDFAAFDQDCVHTDGPPIPMPEKVSRDFASSLDEILPPNFHPGHSLHPDDALHVH